MILDFFRLLGRRFLTNFWEVPANSKKVLEMKKKKFETKISHTHSSYIVLTPRVEITTIGRFKTSQNRFSVFLFRKKSLKNRKINDFDDFLAGS